MVPAYQSGEESCKHKQESYSFSHSIQVGEMRYFRVKNFEKLQPKRKDSKSPWIRLYHTWNLDSAVGQLHDSHKAHYIGLLCIAHTEDNQIPFDNKWVKKRGLFSSPVKLELFEKLGLIEVFGNEDEKIKNKKKPLVRELVSELYTKKNTNEKKSSSEVHQVINFYHDEFQNIFGATPMIDGGKDGKLMKSIVSKYGLEKTQDLITAFLKSDDPWLEGKGRSIALFKSQINKLIIPEAPKVRVPAL